MKRTKLFLGLLPVIILHACMSSQYTYTDWLKDTTLHNLEFSQLRYSVYKTDGDTSAVLGYLSKPALIDSFPCEASWVHFDKDWNLTMFQLSDNIKLINHVFHKGSWLIFPESGKIICAFPQDTLIQGFSCRGNANEFAAKGIHTSFYPNGRLKGFYPPDDITIDNIPCKSTLFTMIELHENGKLKSCRLADDIVVNNRQLQKNDHILLDPDGNLIDN